VGRRLRDVRRARSRRPPARLRGGARPRRLVGRGPDHPVRRLCDEPRRGRGAGTGRRGFRRARAGGLARRAQPESRGRRADAARCGAGTMMRALLMCGIAAAALLAADGARAQAPMQITPPAARPPASIPGKPAKKPAVAKPAAAKPAVAKPALKKSIEPKVAKPPPGAPSAFAPEQVQAAPFTAPEKMPPQPSLSQQAAL